MMGKHRVLVSLAVLVVILAGARVSYSQENADQVFLVRVAHEHGIDAIHDYFDPCSVDPEGAVVYLTADQIASLSVPHEVLCSLEEHYRQFRPSKTMEAVGVPSIARALGEPVTPTTPVASSRGATRLTYERYHTLEEGIALMTSLAAAYPEIAEMTSLGQSIEGREIWALKVTDNPQLVEPEEETVMFCGVHHAREWATHETMLYLAEHLVAGYDKDLHVQHLVNNSVIWLIPVVNPDGFAYTWSDNRQWRKNRRDNGDGTIGVDLNRNYDYKWGPGYGGSSGSPGASTYRGASPASEPETQAMQSFLASERPSIAVSLHTYSQLVLYPWGYTGSETAESYTSLRAIADNYVARVSEVYDVAYTPGPSNYAIYTTNGDFTDYAYGAHGCLAYTPELRPISSSAGGFLLPEDQILETCRENLAAFLWVMDTVADAAVVQVPSSPAIFDRGTSHFSIPATPLNQKPEFGLGMEEAFWPFLSSWIYNVFPPFGDLGTYPDDFEAVGVGSTYSYQYGANSAPWADGFDEYKTLSHVFENGAFRLLENTFDDNTAYVGIPSTSPIRMDRLKIHKKVTQRITGTSGWREVILETRTATEDALAPEPWINWTWTHVFPGGLVAVSHPTGAGGADSYLHPYRAYQFESFVDASHFDTTNPDVPAYLLEFPAPIKGDVDGSGTVDIDDYAVLIGCMTGPGQLALSDTCARLDFDRDYDVDYADAVKLLADFGESE